MNDFWMMLEELREKPWISIKNKFIECSSIIFLWKKHFDKIWTVEKVETKREFLHEIAKRFYMEIPRWKPTLAQFSSKVVGNYWSENANSKRDLLKRPTSLTALKNIAILKNIPDSWKIHMKDDFLWMKWLVNMGRLFPKLFSKNGKRSQYSKGE